jgi:LemA protein
MNILWIILGAVGLLVVYFISAYNKFVTLKTRIEASIQEIGNQLKRQADLIPNLMESVKGYMKHEKKIFSDLTEARKMIVDAVKKGNAQDMVNASVRASQALAPIRAVFESTPELQAAGPTSKLMDELRDTADKVMYSRRTLIDLTADYNILMVRFPTNVVASVFNFSKQPGLKMPVGAEEETTQVTKEELKTPKVDLS